MNLDYQFGKNSKLDFRNVDNKTPPLGIMYIASYLEQKGFGVSIIDGTQDINNKQICPRRQLPY